MKILVTGARSLLARAVCAQTTARGHELVALAHADLDVTDDASVRAALARHRPDAVVQCAAYARVDEAESDPAGAFAVNADGASNVARACVAVGARLLYPSTDYVFAGDAARPYRPDDPVAPASVYARSKLEGERAAREDPRALVVRTAWLFGAGRANYVSIILERARAGQAQRVTADQRGCPTWTEDLAVVLLRLLEADAPPGVYHATNAGSATRFELARELLSLAGLSTPLVPVTSDELPRLAPRPRYSVLDCSATEALVGPLAPWRSALARALQAGL